MLRILLSALFLITTVTAQAQLIGGDTITAVPIDRAFLSWNPTNRSLSVRHNLAGTTLQYRFFQNHKINGIGPDANGNYTISTGGSVSAVSQLTNDLGFLTNTTGDARYPLLSGTYNNPTWLNQLATSKLTGTLAATNWPAQTGDVTNTAGSFGTTISAGVVTNGKLATAAANTFKGNNTGSTASVIDMTAAQAKVVLSLDQVTNTSDANKPVSTAQATAIAVKSSAKRFARTADANGTTINHGLGSTLVVVLFKPTGANGYDNTYNWGVTDANNITIVTPYNASGVRETFTGELIIFTTN